MPRQLPLVTSSAASVDSHAEMVDARQVPVPGVRLDARVAAAVAAGRGGRRGLAAGALALQRSAGNRDVARSLSARRVTARPTTRVLARQRDPQEVMMGMMWERMGQEISGMITGL